MKQDISTITGSVNYNAPTITPTDCFNASNATRPEKPVYYLKTTGHAQSSKQCQTS